MKKYVLKVGYFEPRRKCTVRAKDEEEAFMKCRTEMDRRHDKAGTEPPVGYDMEIVEVSEV